jgi:hypothetical protein
MKKGRSRPSRQFAANRAIPKIKEHHGRTIETISDRFSIGFVSAVDAVRRTVEAQRGMIGRDTAVPRPRRIEFRIGVERSDIVMDGRVGKQRPLQPGHIR